MSGIANICVVGGGSDAPAASSVQPSQVETDDDRGTSRRKPATIEQRKTTMELSLQDCAHVAAIASMFMTLLMVLRHFDLL